MVTEERVIELEVRIAYQEDTLSALDRIVTEQAAEIDRLEKMTREIYQRFEQLSHQLDSGETGEQNEPPPHY